MIEKLRVILVNIEFGILGNAKMWGAKWNVFLRK
jgi:hypothetical protein